VNMVMNLQIPFSSWNFFTNRAIVGFSERSQFPKRQLVV
jgi:hypothetical protein